MRNTIIAAAVAVAIAVNDIDVGCRRTNGVIGRRRTIRNDRRKPCTRRCRSGCKRKITTIQ